MRIATNRKMLSAAVLCFAVILVPTIVLTQEKPDTEAQAIATRQGYMKLVLWEAGPLFGMAKGKIAYDAETAKAHAARLKTISQYPVGVLFLPGTSNVDRPGKTRSLPKIWEDMKGYEKAITDWQKAVANLSDQAGNGQSALAAAVGDMGKSCGNCHKPYRAKEF